MRPIRPNITQMNLIITKLKAEQAMHKRMQRLSWAALIAILVTAQIIILRWWLVG